MWDGAHRTRVRLVQQVETGECGLACLTMVAGTHGLEVDLGTLRRRFPPSLKGASLRGLVAIADAMGLAPRALKVPSGQLANIHLPAMLHWDLDHFVVLERVKRGRALIHNPAGHSRWHSAEQVSEHFTGIALELRPTTAFQTGRHRERLRLTDLWSRVTGAGRSIAQAIILSFVLQAYVLAAPYYLRVVVDEVLPSVDLDLLIVLAIGFALFAIVNAGVGLLRSHVLLIVGTALSFGIGANVARKLFRLPIPWFEKRRVGDVLSRFQSIKPIQDALTQGAVAAILDGLLVILVIVVMFFFSVPLTLIALGASAVYALVRAASFRVQREAQENSIVASAREQSTMIESLRGIVLLRLSNREAHRHAHWQGHLTSALNAQMRSARIGLWQKAASTLLFGLETVLVVYIAARAILTGDFSLGMLFAFMAYRVQLQERGAALIDQFFVFRMLDLHMERISDIALSDDDPSIASGFGLGLPTKGGLALRDLRFRYDAMEPLVLDGVNLDVKAGEHIAITGPSGGGKSTLLKVVLGLAEAESGEVLVDGLLLRDFGLKNFHEQVAVVLQEDVLFAGSIAENIALFDDTPDMSWLVECAVASAIHEDIARMTMGYQTLVGELGSALSGGQKQRVLLARALYRRPKILFMDEGTAHLDVRTEKMVNEAIRSLGITRIIVAHRAETLACADRVYVLERGQLRPEKSEAVEGRSCSDDVAAR